MRNTPPGLIASALIFVAVVVFILTMTGLVFLTYAIAEMLMGGEYLAEVMICVVSLWVSLAAGLVVSGTLIAGGEWRWRRCVLGVSGICLLFGLSGTAVGASIIQTREYRPMNTAAEARPWLESMLKQRVRSFPNALKVIDLGRQIRNIRVLGPKMTFEPETARYVEFELDTGCGSVVRLTASLVPGEGEISLLSRQIVHTEDPRLTLKQVR